MKETRIYIVNVDDIDDNESVEQLTDEQFIEKAEKRGTIYSLKGFEKAWNEGIYMDTPNYSYIRILESEITC